MIVLISCNSNKKLNAISNKGIQKEVNYIPYYLKVYKADSLYLVNDFEGSYKILDSLFKKYEPLSSDNYVEYGIYLNSAVMSNHLDGIDKKVRFGYLHFGNIQTLHKKSHEMYLAVNKAANISKEEVKELKLQYYNNLNLDLRKKMLQMYQDDQTVRLEHKSSEEMDIVDEKNRVELNQIFKKFGFPKKSLIGSNNAYDVPDGGSLYLNIFFMHQSDSVRSKYLPIVLDGVKKGYCEPLIYAIVYDRDLILKGEKQYYGTYTCDEDKICPLQNPTKIDSIRKSIGLPHIKFYPWKVKQFEQE
ncbi:hypothetical protein OX284_000165 [Flavobacterium sp. SUN046]|uniref:hypothetical protein n=1 Tax=Flavobacterium sp. SUN046 TaxID=3002440 RepID=UPI002DBE9F0F|nr:hypothetical protein [Flavobacterium sp. SUN046]MEC4047826.1 hypothetical protein [Flavobacterium sp. SUN046]